MALNDLWVEVRLENNVAFKALIEDFDSEGVNVSLGSGEMQSRRVNFEQVFLAPKEVDRSTQPAEGDECEVFWQISAEKSAPYGWHPAKIKTIRGGFCMFTFTAAENTDTDVIETEQIRKVYHSSPITPSSLFKLTVEVPSNSTDLASELKSHDEYKKHITPAKMAYNPDTHDLIVITANDTLARSAEILMDFHLRFLERKAAQMRRVKLAQQNLEGASQPRDLKRQLNAQHVETFSIPDHLMGYAIGPSGRNIMLARHSPGILHIGIDDNKLFSIYADSERSAVEARKILEFGEKTVHIPRDKIARVIGKSGSSIQEMIDRTGVVRVKIEGDQSNGTDNQNASNQDTVPIILTGTLSNVEDMNIMINYLLMHMEEVDELIAQSGGGDHRNSITRSRLSPGTSVDGPSVHQNVH